MTQHDARQLPLQDPKGSVLDCCRAGVALSRATAVLMIVAATLWALVNGRYEGATLIVLVRGHGLTVGDLPSVVLVLASGWFLLPATESPRGSVHAARPARQGAAHPDYLRRYRRDAL
jgi:hypothetical protein